MDRLFARGNTLRCQLWGLKADGVAVIDRENVRSKVGWMRVVHGILTVPVFGIGLLLIFSGIRLLAADSGNDRQRMFEGKPGRLPPPLPVQTVRI